MRFYLRFSEWAVYSQRRMPPDVARTIEFVKATRRGRILGFAAWYKPIPSTVADPPADPAPSASDPTEPIDEALEAIFAASEDRAFRQDFKTRARQIREDYHAGRPYWYLVRRTKQDPLQSLRTKCFSCWIRAASLCIQTRRDRALARSSSRGVSSKPMRPVCLSTASRPRL